MAGFFKRLFGRSQREENRLNPESEYIVKLDELSVVCTLPDGTSESVRWDDLSAVVIETNDTGPWGCDVMYILVGQDAKSGCIVPQLATGEEQLVERLQQLPGFDNEQFIAAMCSTENQKFLCWEKAT